MKIPVIDLHADTYMKKLIYSRFPGSDKLYKKSITENDITKNDKNDNITNNLDNTVKSKFIKITDDYDITIDYLKAGNVKVQTQSLYIADPFILNSLHSALNIVQMIKSDIKKYNQFQVYNVNDIEKNLSNEKNGILISIEGLEVIENDLDLLDIFYELGVRIVAPTWNRALRYFSSVEEQGGILSEGKELINKMKKLNLILDTSHMSEKSFFDAARFDIPLIATHSNAKGVNFHKRNLSDEQIKVLMEKEGVMGINFNPPFLKPDEYNKFLNKYSLNLIEVDYIDYNNMVANRSNNNFINRENTKDYSLNKNNTDKGDQNILNSIQYKGKIKIDKKTGFPEGYYWIYNLIDYISNKFSIDLLAFGSDFDGIGSHPDGVENAAFYQDFALFLQNMGLSKDEIEKILYKNALRVFKKL